MKNKISRREYIKGAAAMVAAGAITQTTIGCKNDSADTVSFSSEFPVKYNVDVFVAGGGPAGCATAVSAAETGHSVFLAESHSCLGGMGTAAKVPVFMQLTDGKNFLCAGFGRRIIDSLRKNRRIGGEANDIEALKRIYDDLMLKSGAKFTFQTTLMAVKKTGNKIDYVLCYAPSGVFAVKAKVYIDCTGNGDMAVQAGAKWEMTPSNEGRIPATLCGVWGGIDWKKWHAVMPKDNPQPQGYKLAQAIKDGVFTVPDYHMTGTYQLGDNIGVSNISHAFNVDGTDEKSVTKALVESRKTLIEFENYYNKYIEGFEKAKLIGTGSLLGVRETRRIMGDYVLNFEDYKKRAVFDDEIGRYAYPIDIHPSGGDMAEYEKHRRDFDRLYRYKKGESYGIPYRILTPKGIDNLLVAGRCVSSDHLVHGSVRVMPACYIMGQAAGLAACQAADAKVSVHDIDVKKLQKSLLKIGAFLPNAKA